MVADVEQQQQRAKAEPSPFTDTILIHTVEARDSWQRIREAELKATTELCAAQGEAGRTSDFRREATASGPDDAAAKGERGES